MAQQQLHNGNPDGVALGQTTTTPVTINGVLTINGESVPLVQSAALTATGSAVASTAATSTTPFGYAEAQANAIVTLVNALKVTVDEMAAALVAAGIVAAS